MERKSTMTEYQVYCRRKPSPGRTFYDGEETVFAEDREDAIEKAWRKIKSNFREDTKSCWNFEIIGR